MTTSSQAAQKGFRIFLKKVGGMRDGFYNETEASRAKGD
jgi:hypothetical protein